MKKEHYLFCTRKNSLLIFITALFFPTCLFAETIKGRVTDSRTGEPVSGATVSIGKEHKPSLTGLDGSFEIKEVKPGTYTLSIVSVSYTIYTQKLTVDGKTDLPFLAVILNPESKSLGDVVVNSGHSNGKTDAGARQLEKASDNVVNILSTHQLQLAPDVTVANVLRRVSGVTVDRGSDGEGRYPVIRGMDKRYNYTLINGIKIPSPDDKNRYVPMDIFPSEMLQRLEVIKSLTPDMEGDAIGGVMNLVMKDAPDHFSFSAQGALGYSQMLFNQSFTSYDHGAVNSKAPVELGLTPTFNNFSTQNLAFTQGHPLPDGQLGFTIGNRYLDKKLGVILSGSYQSTDHISTSLFFGLSPQPLTPLDSTMQPNPTDEEHRVYSIHQDRLGLHAKLDYRLGANSRLSFYTVFIQLNSYESRFITDSTSTDRNAPGLGEVDYQYRSKSNFQSIYNATLQGQHTIKNNWLVDWTIAYSQAGQQTPDQATLTTYQVFFPNTTPPPPYIHDMERIWQHNSDKDIAGYLNLHYKFKFKGQSFDLGAGGMYRHKDRYNYYYDYDFVPTSSSDTFTTVQNAFPPTHTPSTNITISPNTYNATEDITAGYGELRWLPNAKWNILAGVRFENTSQTYNQILLPITSPAKMGAYNYLDPLPSMQIKYKLNDKAALHLAYFSSISRPGFFELVPFEFVGEYYTEHGNDTLRRAKAYNIDLRYELFPGVADQLLIGAFYKNIHDPIEYVYARPATSESLIEPENIGTAINIGAEIVYTHYFNKFGVSLNYTYTHSTVSSTYRFTYETASTPPTVITLTKDRPLQGQAAHIGNISLLYKDPKSGIELQLSTIYTGRHITYLSQYGSSTNTMDYWQRGTVVEDFSGEKTLGKHFSLYAKLNNLLNTPDIIEMLYPSGFIKGIWPDAAQRSDRVLVEKKYFGQTYLIGIRWHL